MVSATIATLPRRMRAFAASSHSLASVGSRPANSRISRKFGLIKSRPSVTAAASAGPDVSRIILAPRCFTILVSLAKKSSNASGQASARDHKAGKRLNPGKQCQAFLPFRVIETGSRQDETEWPASAEFVYKEIFACFLRNHKSLAWHVFLVQQPAKQVSCHAPHRVDCANISAQPFDD